MNNCTAGWGGAAAADGAKTEDDMFWSELNPDGRLRPSCLCVLRWSMDGGSDMVTPTFLMASLRQDNAKADGWAWLVTRPRGKGSKETGGRLTGDEQHLAEVSHKEGALGLSPHTSCQWLLAAWNPSAVTQPRSKLRPVILVLPGQRSHYTSWFYCCCSKYWTAHVASLPPKSEVEYKYEQIPGVRVCCCCCTTAALYDVTMGPETTYPRWIECSFQ